MLPVVFYVVPHMWWLCPECGSDNVERGYDWPVFWPWGLTRKGNAYTDENRTANLVPDQATYEEWLYCLDCEIDRGMTVTWCPLDEQWFARIKCG